MKIHFAHTIHTLSHSTVLHTLLRHRIQYIIIIFFLRRKSFYIQNSIFLLLLFLQPSFLISLHLCCEFEVKIKVEIIYGGGKWRRMLSKDFKMCTKKLLSSLSCRYYAAEEETRAQEYERRRKKNFAKTFHLEAVFRGSKHRILLIACCHHTHSPFHYQFCF